MAAPRKTTQVQDETILAEYKHGAKVANLARAFGISASTVRSIVRRKNGSIRPVGRPSNS